MPEETISSAAESARRRSAVSSESSGGGIKVLAAVLAVVVAALGFALYKGRASADLQSEADAKTIGTLSNQVAELRTKLALEHSNVELVQSNQQAQVLRRTAELITTSNRLVQTSLLFDHAREATRAAQADIATRAADSATVEAHRDELIRESAVIPGLRHEVADLKERLQQAQFAQAALQERLGKVSAEKAGLERRLEDSAFLKLQARRADEAAELRQRTAANQRIRTTDPRVHLEFQPDGTVRAASAAGSPPPK